MRHLKRNLTILAILALVVAIPATPLMAQDPKPVRGHGMRYGPGDGEPGRMLERMVRHLELSEEQTVRVEQIFQERREQTRPLRELAEAAHDEFAALMWAEELDETALRNAATALADIQVKLKLFHAQAFRELRGVLDEDQLATLAEFHEQRGDRRGGHHGRGHGSGRQP